jgi:hypothetical protein
MPTISIFFGTVVQMYWRQHPPHGRHCERCESNARATAASHSLSTDGHLSTPYGSLQ